MQTYARVDGGVVAELFATDGDINKMFHPDIIWVPCNSTVRVGDSYDGAHFTAAVSVTANQVPQEVSRFQARAALLQVGQLDSVEAYINQPTTDRLVKEAWDNVQVFRRKSLMVMTVAGVLGLSSAEIDELFRSAASINV